MPLTSTSLGLARRLLVLGRVRIPREATRAMSPLLDGTTVGTLLSGHWCSSLVPWPSP